MNLRRDTHYHRHYIYSRNFHLIALFMVDCCISWQQCREFKIEKKSIIISCLFVPTSSHRENYCAWTTIKMNQKESRKERFFMRRNTKSMFNVTSFPLSLHAILLLCGNFNEWRTKKFWLNLIEKRNKCLLLNEIWHTHFSITFSLTQFIYCSCMFISPRNVDKIS